MVRAARRGSTPQNSEFQSKERDDFLFHLAELVIRDEHGAKPVAKEPAASTRVEQRQLVYEFFYMASPFAIYLYGAYLPGLEFLNRIPRLSWLTGFYLPHFTASSSALITLAPLAGGFSDYEDIVFRVLCVFRG